MRILRRIASWFKAKARVRKIRAAAREHGRRSLQCALCHDDLLPTEFARGYCDHCFFLADEPRPFGAGSVR